jgi:hypothetical protein
MQGAQSVFAQLPLPCCRGQGAPVLLRNNVSTTAGSSGAPVFDKAGRLVGVHFASHNSVAASVAWSSVAPVLGKLKNSIAVVERMQQWLDDDRLDDAEKEYWLLKQDLDPYGVAVEF